MGIGGKHPQTAVAFGIQAFCNNDLCIKKFLTFDIIDSPEGFLYGQALPPQGFKQLPRVPVPNDRYGHFSDWYLTFPLLQAFIQTSVGHGFIVVAYGEAVVRTFVLHHIISSEHTADLVFNLDIRCLLDDHQIHAQRRFA